MDECNAEVMSVLFRLNKLPESYLHNVQDGVFELDGVETFPPPGHRRVDIETRGDKKKRIRMIIQKLETARAC